MNKRDRLAREKMLVAQAELMETEALDYHERCELLKLRKEKERLTTALKNQREIHLAKMQRLRLRLVLARRGFWQYLMDHSYFTHYGRHRIAFTIQDKENFWTRVDARVKGKYKVYKAEDREEKAKELQAIALEKGYVDRIDFVSTGIQRKGSLKDKMILWIYKKADAYLKNYEEK